LISFNVNQPWIWVCRIHVAIRCKWDSVPVWYTWHNALHITNVKVLVGPALPPPLLCSKAFFCSLITMSMFLSLKSAISAKVCKNGWDAQQLMNGKGKKYIPCIPSNIN
jgi:hypothetical protein